MTARNGLVLALAPIHRCAQIRAQIGVVQGVHGGKPLTLFSSAIRMLHGFESLSRPVMLTMGSYLKIRPDAR